MKYVFKLTGDDEEYDYVELSLPNTTEALARGYQFLDAVPKPKNVTIQADGHPVFASLTKEQRP